MDVVFWDGVFTAVLAITLIGAGAVALALIGR